MKDIIVDVGVEVLRLTRIEDLPGNNKDSTLPRHSSLKTTDLFALCNVQVTEPLGSILGRQLVTFSPRESRPSDDVEQSQLRCMHICLTTTKTLRPISDIENIALDSSYRQLIIDAIKRSDPQNNAQVSSGNSRALLLTKRGRVLEETAKNQTKLAPKTTSLTTPSVATLPKRPANLPQPLPLGPNFISFDIFKSETWTPHSAAVNLSAVKKL